MDLDGKTALSEDGRQTLVQCPRHGANPLVPLLDPLDGTCWLFCTECKAPVLTAEVLSANVNASAQVESIDDLDPRLQDLVRAHRREAERGDGS